MPRANRHFLPGQLWHITHRCHEKSFLLRFARDRRTYHIHLLVKDTGEGVIAQSMQLIAGRTGQEYNQRKGRQGAFWEDRYHATAVEGDEHLHRCLVYIDLNMVRAGVVRHPAQWVHGGYREIQHPPKRYALIELPDLSALCGFATVEDFQVAHRRWVEEALTREVEKRDERWSEAIAVGSQAFVEKVRQELGIAARHREVDEADGTCVLREPRDAYTCVFGAENSVLRPKNTVFWTENPANA